MRKKMNVEKKKEKIRRKKFRYKFIIEQTRKLCKIKKIIRKIEKKNDDDDNNNNEKNQKKIKKIEKSCFNIFAVIVEL